ncbi:hypothetical protein DdX_14311 [Ditylenchus destructor]|uniref:F-box domain-containing protein n=1 Tax=Ditylenchus destructor TaxID=166010 RepID=A0AAD4R1T2_9BILA|nr:hypothetical protein DdX_14311 [Ditylenchus destructor]
MEREFGSDDILLETRHRIEFPLYTQLDIFKFLRAYDLHRKCVNVSKDWRDVIQKYAQELPKFRDLGPEIEKLNKTLEAKQKREEKFAQHIDVLKIKRNKHYCFAAAITLSTFTLCLLSSVIALLHIHKDEDATFSIADSLDEILAMVALTWTTLGFVHSCEVDEYFSSHPMESKFDDENISLMNHRRIEFPLYTQLDIFKFLRAYDLQKSCINVSKEWRDTIRRYAGELPKFRDQRDRRAIVRVG